MYRFLDLDGKGPLGSMIWLKQPSRWSARVIGCDWWNCGLFYAYIRQFWQTLRSSV